MSERLIRLSRSVIGSEEVAAVSRVLLEDGYLGMGKEVQAFENDVAAFLGVPAERVVSMNSGTAALHLAVAGSLNPGDEVLVQSLTFVSDFQAIAAAGAVPVACEVDPDTFTIDLQDAAKRITPKTRAIMPVHYASFPGDLDAIYAFARNHHLRVIEDAAHAFGSYHNGKMIGSFGDIACFSFDGIKNITTGEGGVVVTADERVIRRVQDARLLGVEKDTERRFRGERSWDFDVHYPGYRYHMSNIFAAIGRVQLRRLKEEFAPKRVRLANIYRKRLSGVGGVKLLNTDLSRIIPHIQPARILNSRRDSLRAELEKHGIQTGIHYKPNHLLSLFGGHSQVLPVTESVYEELLSLPLHPMLEPDDVEFVCDRTVDFLRSRPAA